MSRTNPSSKRQMHQNMYAQEFYPLRTKKAHTLPVVYRSKTMTLADCNYDVHDKEVLAIVQAIKEWKRYMAGKLLTEVNILTYHRNLLTFTTTKQLNGRQVRWMETLVEQPFIIRYQPGKENGKADTSQ